MPVAEASQWVDATMPKVPRSSGLVVNIGPSRLRMIGAPSILATWQWRRRVIHIHGRNVARLCPAANRNLVSTITPFQSMWIAKAGGYHDRSGCFVGLPNRRTFCATIAFSRVADRHGSLHHSAIGMGVPRDHRHGGRQ